MKNTVKVSGDMIHQAYHTWIKEVQPLGYVADDTPGPDLAWFKFLGISPVIHFDIASRKTNTHWVPEKAARIMQGLCSPHYKTLAKVWKIQASMEVGK